MSQRLYTYLEVDLLARLTGFEVMGAHRDFSMKSADAVNPITDPWEAQHLLIFLRKQ